MGSFIYPGSITSKDSESSKHVKSRMAKAQGICSWLEKSLEEQTDKSGNQD